MSRRWATFLLWAVIAASLVAWALKLFVKPLTAPPQTSVVGMGQPPRGDVTRVLGVDAPPPPEPGATQAQAPADARFQLIGVLAPRSEKALREGVALIAVDGKPPRAYRVGARVEGDYVLQAVRARGADLGPAGGSPAVALNIPPPAPAATGTLPDARGVSPSGAPGGRMGGPAGGPGGGPVGAPPALALPRTPGPATPAPMVPPPAVTGAARAAVGPTVAPVMQPQPVTPPPAPDSRTRALNR
jgi:general secretion pathway protein C